MARRFRSPFPCPGLGVLAMGAVLFAAGLGQAAVMGTPTDVTFKSLNYDINLVPDFAAGTVAGVERLRFESLADGVRTLAFTPDPLAVNAVLADGTPVSNAIEGERRVFHLARPLRKGEVATLVMSFAGRPKRDVAFDADEIHTNFFTCEVMICDDARPGDRATLSFALTLPVGMDAVAPGRLVSRGPAGEGREVWRWREDRTYPSYLYGFAAGRYSRARLDATGALSVLYRNETPERVQAMFADTARMIAFYESKAGVPLPEGRYTQVLASDDAAQEDAALTMIGEDNVAPILKDPHKDGLVAHELSHQWWGNLITCADWKELWLNEGLTSFMVAAYKEQRWGRADYDRQIASAKGDWVAAKAAGLDVPLSYGGDYPTLKDKRRIAYGKAVVFFDALRTELGEAAFWKGLRDYTRANAGRSVTARDLETAFEAASGRDLSPMFRQWVFGDPASATSGASGF